MGGRITVNLSSERVAFQNAFLQIYLLEDAFVFDGSGGEKAERDLIQYGSVALILIV